MSFDLEQPVAIPARLDTGVIKQLLSEGGEMRLAVALDHGRSTANLGHGEVAKFIWKKRTYDGSFLYLAKAWQNHKGHRRLSIYCHRVRDDGSLGGRIRHLNRTNGF